MNFALQARKQAEKALLQAQLSPPEPVGTAFAQQPPSTGQQGDRQVGGVPQPVSPAVAVAAAPTQGRPSALRTRTHRLWAAAAAASR